MLQYGVLGWQSGTPQCLPLHLVSVPRMSSFHTNSSGYHSWMIKLSWQIDLCLTKKLNYICFTSGFCLSLKRERKFWFSDFNVFVGRWGKKNELLLNLSFRKIPYDLTSVKRAKNISSIGILFIVWYLLIVYTFWLCNSTFYGLIIPHMIPVFLIWKAI